MAGGVVRHGPPGTLARLTTNGWDGRVADAASTSRMGPEDGRVETARPYGSRGWGCGGVVRHGPPGTLARLTTEGDGLVRHAQGWQWGRAILGGVGFGDDDPF